MVEVVGGTQKVRAAFDLAADVMYLSLGAPRPDEGEDGPCGIIYRFGIEDDLPSGVTIVGYLAMGWSRKSRDLATIVSEHLKADIDEVLRSVLRAESEVRSRH